MRILCFAALVAFGACAGPAQDTFLADRDIGIAGFSADSIGCARFPAPRPQPGARIILASTLPDAALLDARVLAPAESRCPEMDPALGDSLVAISVFNATESLSGSYWFALRVPPNALAIVGAGISGDLTADGVSESLRICTSQEGLWFSVWTGDPLTGRRLWSEYVALFYDVEPSCDERDFADPVG